MAILNPEHLLDQATRLVQSQNVGQPRQADLRRAISAAYYAVFHEIITAAADQVVGVTLRQSREHALVCRSINHMTINGACVALAKVSIPHNYAAYVPAGGFGADITTVLTAFPDLIESRHAADYDTLARFGTADAKTVIQTSRATIAALRNAPLDDRKAFLFLLLFPPKR